MSMSEKILIIEDEQRLRTNLKILLTDAGYDITTAKNGKEGMQYLRREPFALVITDIVMKEMSGFEVMEQITALGLDTLVIVITGFVSIGSAIEALRKGAYDYLVKPFEFDLMQFSIKRALEKVRLQRQLKAYMQSLEQRVAERTTTLEVINGQLNRSLEELKAAQERLIQNEKLSALGELISGVAHEINNPLTTVLGYAEILAIRHDYPTEARFMVDEIRREAIRCGHIIKNLLGFARKQKPEKRYADINTLCLQTLEMLEYQLKVNQITTETHLAETLPKTMVDGAQLQQVLINILANAYQAMTEYRGQGHLTVTTAYDSQKIYIQIADNGPGIAAENLYRIFDPFFTTKEKGTGLGLSLSYGIMKEHAGGISVASTLGQGTTFTIELPIVAEVTLVQDTTPNSSAPPALSPKTVLVVDDEQPVLDLLSLYLQRLGHQPEVTHSGEEALQKIDRQAYDLIICDLRMPGLDGRQVYQYVKNKYPELLSRLIFVTGDTLHETTHKFLKECGCPVLIKPFLFEEFAQVFYQGLQRAG
jgi:two-component system, NtrC family, sensor kinase